MSKVYSFADHKLNKWKEETDSMFWNNFDLFDSIQQKWINFYIQNVEAIPQCEYENKREAFYRTELKNVGYDKEDIELFLQSDKIFG